MPVDEAIAHYGTLTERVFSTVKPFGRDGKFSATKFEEVIKQIVQERTGNADERMMDTEGAGCKMYVVHNHFPMLRS